MIAILFTVVWLTIKINQTITTKINFYKQRKIELENEIQEMRQRWIWY